MITDQPVNNHDDLLKVTSGILNEVGLDLNELGGDLTFAGMDPIRPTRLKVGAQGRWYENRGSFGVTTRDLSAFVELGFGRGYVAHLGYRDRDYDQTQQDWDDYRARITELSIGYRW